MSIGSRIKEVRKHEGLSRKEFGNRLGVSMDTIANMEYDRLKKPEQKEPLYKLICNEFGISYEWLTTGAGDVFTPISQEKAIADFAGEVIKCDDESFKKRLVTALSKFEDEDWEALERVLDKIMQGK